MGSFGGGGEGGDLRERGDNKQTEASPASPLVSSSLSFSTSLSLPLPTPTSELLDDELHAIADAEHGNLLLLAVREEIGGHGGGTLDVRTGPPDRMMTEGFRSVMRFCCWSGFGGEIFFLCCGVGRFMVLVF